MIIAAARIDDHRSTDPVRLPTNQAAAPAAPSPECTSLLAAMPDELGDYPTARIAEPVPPGTHAWRRSDGTAPIVLRCGLDRPPEFTVGAALQQVDGVLWFEAANPDPTTSTWYAVDRAVYVTLSLPRDAGPTPLQVVAEAITAALPARPIDPAPVPG
ncbi:DUF3515 domain-containing protein [Skermania piniformis]|uniref:DUF3515 domain-containing protein n=1 Tax=Skermania pinensis TaxID=39122 RepID=A0ABX8S6D9_9ACTN|nr:DUF3515 domain-containing protein [Skermania piniformis]